MRRPSWAPALPAALLLALGCTVAPGDSVPEVPLPAPAGPLAVGTEVHRWVDSSRIDPLDRRTEREIGVRLWYPAVRSGRPLSAPYVEDLEQLEDLLGAEQVARLRSVRTHASRDAPRAARTGRRPVIVISHGLGSLPEYHSILGAELASRGALVVGINHTHGSQAAVLSDGRVVGLHPEWRPRLDAAGDSAFRAAVESWSADIRFVLDRLVGTAEAEVGRPEDGAGRAPIAVVGHSLGGSAAVVAAAADPRVAAVVSLDGGRGMPATAAVAVPFLFVMRDESHRNVAEMADRLGITRRELSLFLDRYDSGRTRVLARATGVTYRAVIAGTAHNDFTDLPLVRERAYGALPAGRTIELVNLLVLAFLDRHLADLVEGVRDPAALESDHPEIRITRPDSTHGQRAR